MTHILVTLAAQTFVGLLSGRWLLGGLFLSAFYLGREITQAEYRWISSFGEGRRANMPWWGGFDSQVWNLKSGVDAVGPVLASFALLGTVLIIRKAFGVEHRP